MSPYHCGYNHIHPLYMVSVSRHHGDDLVMVNACLAAIYSLGYYGRARHNGVSFLHDKHTET